MLSPGITEKIFSYLENPVYIIEQLDPMQTNIKTIVNYGGHTDYLDKELDGNALMLMVQDNLRVGLLTDHIPVNDVAKHLTEKLIIQKLETINLTLKQDFGINKPKIALLALNPHAGDQGVIGKEDDEIIKPTVKKIFDKGIFAFGSLITSGTVSTSVSIVNSDTRYKVVYLFSDNSTFTKMSAGLQL
jgi:4-hydroxy-L-threonine phosphate dehydrogenase PdxA